MESKHPHPSRASHEPTSPIEGEVGVDCFCERASVADQDKAHASPLVGEVDSSAAKNRVGGSPINPVRIALVGIAVGLLGGGLVLFRSLNLAEAWLPRCTFHLLTGLHCPGCGLTRAVQALLNGKITQAFAYNALWPIVVLVVLPIVARIIWYWMLGTRPVRRVNSYTWVAVGVLIGILVVGFGVMRNVPFEPWRHLAPHELP
jgi:Protein of unknown function (DUF2752)